MKYRVTELASFTNNYLECGKMGRNDSKFAIGKYHVNTMEIIKLLRINIFMPATKFPHLTIDDFGLRKKRREKKDSKILSSSNMGTK